MNATPVAREIVAIQDENAVDVVRGRPIGLLLHAHGAMRLFEDPASGQLFAELVGFRTDPARHFLELLGHLPDIAAEVLVADRPHEYPLDEAPVRSWHARREG